MNDPYKIEKNNLKNDGILSFSLDQQKGLIILLKIFLRLTVNRKKQEDF